MSQQNVAVANQDVAPASSKLMGMPLANGWRITKAIPRPEKGTGGTFSHSYIAENNGKKSFVKAFDFSEAFESDDITKFLQDLTSSYNNEKAILKMCGEQRLSKVVIAMEDGHVQVPGYNSISGKVFYLIFEVADGDIRGQVDETKRFDTLWSMRAIKDVCLGLWQMHRLMVAHQDMKPSNVLIFERLKGFKIADLGRSSSGTGNVPHDEYHVPGDKSYAPPELLYREIHKDFLVRRVGCDIYMLGNLIAFMFGGVNMTGALLSRLDPQFHWRIWTGSYGEVLPYVQQAFTGVLEDLKPNLDPLITEQVISLLKELCNPNPAKRGHPKMVGRSDQYSLERYVSQFDLLCKQVEVRSKRTNK